MKRILDIIGALLGLILLFPVILVLYFLVQNKIGRPVLYTSQRPGKNGKLFRMVKFRSMTETCDSAGLLLPDADRLTGFGEKIRRMSLDELPELWNVLKGDMSLVGPRPLLPEYLPLYSKDQARRHEVRPGITGWAQVNGRNAISWEEKFALDVWYVDNQSLLLDIGIIWRTIRKVIGQKDIAAEGEASMSKFTGSEK